MNLFSARAWGRWFKMDAVGRLIGEFHPYRKQVAVILALGIIISAIQPFCLKLSQQIIDDLQKGQNEQFFKWVPVWLSGIFLISGLAKYFTPPFGAISPEKVIIKLRTALFRKYLEYPMSALDSSRVGDMLSTMQNDLQQINGGIETVCDILKEPLVFIGLVGVALYWDWKLALTTLITAPLVVYLFSKSGAAVKRYSGRNLDQFSDLVSLGQESLTGARVVKVFRLEPILLKKFREVQEGYLKIMWKSIKVQELATPSVEFIGAVLMGGIILYGKYRITNGWLTTGELIAFILALGLLQMPIKKLNNAFLKMKVAEAAADRLYAVLDRPDPVRHTGRQRVSEFRDELVYDQVGAFYGDKRALRNISFRVRRGERVAFVGPSGGGKTTIVNLLPRLYDISEGNITLDGVSLHDLYLDDLRRLISVVTQDTFLFHDTIYENIRYGNPDATSAQIEKAAEAAHCLDFIRRAPDGFQARIGDRGACISGGERQRIAIARAILKEAPILVLDEATSSLDSQSESIVQSALESLMKGKTTLMVAHRFSTVRGADRIYVLDGGMIQEHGHHDQLIDRRGLYTELYQRQTTHTT